MTDARRCLEMLDVAGMRALWRKTSPHLDQLKTDSEILAAMHMARTAAESLPLKARAYSHRWCLDNNYPSQLPDRLKPSAEQLCPVVKTAVGISINFSSRELKPAGDAIRKAMSDEVEDCYAARREDPAYVKPRMNEAGQRERKRLFGYLTKLYVIGSI